MLLFGGLSFTGVTNNFLGDTWSWDGTNWTELTPMTSPAGRDDASMAYDAATQQLLLFGGTNAGGQLGDTWSWTGSNWVQLASAPPARIWPSMAYDAATQQLLLFGGESSGAYLNDTWSWNGTNWTQLFPATSPTAEAGASMDYDPADGSILLFGGAAYSGLINESWSWDGTTWSHLSPATAQPGPRMPRPVSTAYDPANGATLLFGGVGQTYFNDTWVYGAPATIPLTWTELSPTASPPARFGASMAYDAADRFECAALRRRRR